MEKTTYHPLIDSFLKDIPDQVKKAKANNDFLFFVDKLKEEFKDSYYYGTVYPQVHNVEMTFNFEKFSEAKRLLRFLAMNGHKRVGNVVELKESQMMIWKFERFTIRGQFKKTESACHYVQTGTKTVEVPVYELRCPETIDPRFAPAVAEVDGDGMSF
jgi:hypothetical protein